MELGLHYKRVVALLSYHSSKPKGSRNEKAVAVVGFHVDVVDHDGWLHGWAKSSGAHRGRRRCNRGVLVVYVAWNHLSDDVHCIAVLGQRALLRSPQQRRMVQPGIFAWSRKCSRCRRYKHISVEKLSGYTRELHASNCKWSSFYYRAWDHEQHR